jgi:hypothetical protein
MQVKRTVFVLAGLLGWGLVMHSQNKNGLLKEDVTALEDIIVEKYYVSTEADVQDTSGGVLPKGSVTYRIYADLRPGYNLQAVFGMPQHPLYIKTSTRFFNTKQGGQTGEQISTKKINTGKTALDSWLTIGPATNTLYGIPKKDDKDGSIITRSTLDKEDGLVKGRDVQKLLFYGTELSFFDNEKDASVFTINDGAWATINSGKVNTPENRVLIAQLTTDGKLSFELNMQIGSPAGATIQFVASNPTGAEIKFKKLANK